MEFNYELHIGQKLCTETITWVPKQVLVITDDQREIIELFASRRKDADLNTVYAINNIDFTIHPHVVSDKA